MHLDFCSPPPLFLVGRPTEIEGEQDLNQDLDWLENLKFTFNWSMLKTLRLYWTYLLSECARLGGLEKAAMVGGLQFVVFDDSARRLWRFPRRGRGIGQAGRNFGVDG